MLAQTAGYDAVDALDIFSSSFFHAFFIFIAHILLLTIILRLLLLQLSRYIMYAGSWRDLQGGYKTVLR